MSQTETTSVEPSPTPRRAGAARDLLFGLLALQNRFIDREGLLAAFDAWGADRSRGLARHLLDRGALTPGRHVVVEALVAEYLRLHDGDPDRSLTSLGPLGSLGDDLGRSTDPEIRASLGRLGASGDGRAADPGETAPWPPPGGPATAGGRFRILRPHARGGLGEVFLARDTELNRDVALKEIQPGLADDPYYRSRFAFEAEVTGGLEHPGIVPVYGAGYTADGRPCYAMRFIQGESLKEAARRFHEAERSPGEGGGAMALRELLRRFTDVCDAIAYAHSRGILHRDLKPSNIMLGKFGETLVVDWGLAKALGRVEPAGAGDRAADAEASETPLYPRAGEALEPTMAGSAVGTPGYMSPEQVSGVAGELGVRSDVYCLGATLYYLLTGRAPCEGEDRGAVYRKVLAGEVRRPRSINPRVPRALEAVCLKAIARRPADRYESAEALKAEVDRWLADEPVLAHREPIPTRALRWVRRHRPAVVAAAAMLVTAVVALAVHAWRLGREEARTADQLGMTRGALRQLIEVSAAQLAGIPNSHPLRQELARQALAQYEELGRKFPGDPGIRLEKAQVLRVLAGIDRLTGQFAESDRSYEEAIAVLSALCSEHPGGFEYRRWLVEALHERGELYHMNGLVRRAEEFLGRAIARSDAMLLRPIGPSYREARGSALIDLSEVLVLAGHPREAREKAEQAIGLIGPLTRGEAKPEDASRYRWLLCLALVDRADAAREAGDEAGAARDLDAAEDLARPVPPDDPNYDDLKFQLARAARLRVEGIGRDPSAPRDPEGTLDRALGHLTDLIDRNRLMPHYEEEMAATLLARADLRRARHRPEEALADCRDAIARSEHLIGDRKKWTAREHPGYLGLLARAEALAARIEAERGRAGEARTRYDRAIAHLRRAIEIDGDRARDAGALDRIRAEADRAAVPGAKGPG